MCDSGAGSPVERLAGERDIWWGTAVQLWMCQMPAGVIASSVFSARSYCVLLLPQRLEWPRSPLPYWSLKCWATSLLWLDCVSASWVSHILLCVWFRFSQVRALTSSSLLSSLSSSSSSFLNCMDFSYTNRGFIGKPSGKYRDLPYTPVFSVPVHPQLSSAFHTHTVGEPTWHPYQPKLTAYIMVGYWCCTGHSVAVTDVQPTRMPIVVSHGIISVFCLFICPSP